MAKKRKVAKEPAPKVPRKGIKPRSSRDKAMRSLAIAKRQEIVSRHYFAGKTMQEIAELAEVAIGTVSTDLEILRKQWQEDAKREFDHWQAQELARVDKVEAEAWMAWELSLRDAETTTVVREEDEDGNPIEKHMLQRKGQSGNPKYLDVIAKCVDQRWKLLGFDKEKDDGVGAREVIPTMIVKVSTREEADDYLRWRDLSMSEN